MRKTSKYVGRTFDCFWECVSCGKRSSGGSSYYVLRNVRSGMEVEVVGSQLLCISQGKATVSHLLYSRIRKENKERGGFALRKGGKRKWEDSSSRGSSQGSPRTSR